VKRLAGLGDTLNTVLARAMKRAPICRSGAIARSIGRRRSEAHLQKVGGLGFRVWGFRVYSGFWG
jgi:hypothetical protein